MTVRTRFAPSPTGYMHIGGMRTALFCWLWARRNEGQFILRIDDTDQQRNVDEALGPILEAFRWLGLDWDEGPEVGGPHGPYFQSQRRPLYDAALKKLLDTGKAYRDFEPPGVTQAERETAEKEKRVYVSSRASLTLSPQEIEQRIAAGDPFVVRLMVPRGEVVAIDDHVRGHVEWDCSLMPDPVIARTDGSPLYNFATAVDDAAFRITHVIRAEEHLPNTPIQVLLHRALGNPIPEWAHIPYVASPGSREKMSKRRISKYRSTPQFQKMFEIGDQILGRTGVDPASDALSPVMVAYYQAVGFLPASVLNALVRLGWSLDDSTEIFSLDEMKRVFSLDRVIRSPAGLDTDKLLSFQSHWMNQLSPSEKLVGVLPFLIKARLIPEADVHDPKVIARVASIVDLAGDRLRLFGDILQFDEFFVDDTALTIDEKNFHKRVIIAPGSAERLAQIRDRLSTLTDFKAERLHDLLQLFLQEAAIKAGDLFPALRLCVTGKAQGSDLFRSLELLGQDCVVRRIDRALQIARNHVRD